MAWPILLLLQPIAGAEHPRYHGHAAGDNRHRDQHARPDWHVGDGVEAPAKATDHVDDWVEQGDRPEWLVERLYRIKGAAEEGQRRDDQHRDDLELLEVLRPHPDRKAEEAEAGADSDQEQDHRERMMDVDGYEQSRGGNRDERQDDG